MMKKNSLYMNSFKILYDANEELNTLAKNIIAKHKDNLIKLSRKLK